MAGQNKISTMRIYRTADGELVGEADPQAAFLAYAIGSEIPAEKVGEYDAFVASLNPPDPEGKAAEKAPNKAAAKPADK